MLFSEAGFDTLANALCITIADLRADLEDDQTLADTAGDDLQDLVSNYQTANQEEMKISSMQAIEDEDLS